MRPVVISVTGQGLAHDPKAAWVVIDATTSPSFEGAEALEYFEISTAYS